MSAALGLLRAGFKVSLFEQAPALGEVGAGLTVQPSATRAMDFLGLGKELRELADLSLNPIVYHYKTGEAMSEFMGAGQTVDENGVSWFHRIHRADFQSMLERAIREVSTDTIHLGSRVARVEQDDHGASVMLENGAEVRGDIIIGADGVRSPIRGQLFDEAPPQFRGQVAYRFLVPMERVRDILGGRPAGTYIGPGCIFNRYPVRHDTILNCVGIVKTDGWKDEGWSTPATREELHGQYAGWHESLTGLIEHAPSENLIKWALYDREPLTQWTNGRVTLLGDAAHPILPFLGLAGAMAIEDAVVLARACAASPDDLQAALHTYEKIRLPRTTDILINSRLQGELYQDPDTDSFLSKKRPHTNPELYGYDPATVAL
ncbi:hypothetical protein ASF70_02905 [Rhizobium sp. Leaf321]|jgi:salicylate hydroxylase|nr:hypothetical protein ASF70_02905 [Rhizobium sp. Leaf321]MBD8652779.1 FAD-dependent monooxygenase [Rhizobium sp. CFBP 13726]